MKNLHYLSAVMLLMTFSGTPASVYAEVHGIPGSSQENTRPSRISLSEAVDIAYRRIPQSKVFDSMQLESDALRDQSKALFAGNPALSASYQTDQGASDTGLEEWEAGIELPLWRFGQKAARQAYAQTSDNLVAMRRNALLLDIAGKVREAVWDVYLAQISLTQATKEWETSQILEQDVKRRVQLGESAKTDLMLAQDQALSKHNIVLGAEAELVHARKRYQALTGLQSLPVKPEEERSDKTTINADHPLLAERLAEVQLSRSNVRIVAREKSDSPQLLIGTRRERDMRGSEPVNSFGVSVRIPFSTGRQSAPKTAAAQVNLSKAQSRMQVTRRDLQAALYEAEHELETNQKRLNLVRKQAKLANGGLRLAKHAFSLGESDLLNLLRVQALAFNAERNKQQLKVSIKRATARYNQAIGVLP